MSEPANVVVLSPHLDDAALSCGGALHRWAASRRRVLSITVFAGDVPAEPPSPIAAEVLHYMGLDAESAMAKRRAEDRRACATLGVDAEHWSFCECIFRSRSDGAPHYATRESIFGPPADADARALAPALEQLLRELPATSEVLAPLGVGGHVDHQLLRRAAEEVFGARLGYFEDYPYARRSRALGRALGHRSAWATETVPLDADDLEAKLCAISAYESQVVPLFRSERRMRRLVRRYARKRKGERFWRRR